ncbi:MAG: DUF4296 domain-containing protein [Flavobacteriales bacterium]
MRTLLPLIVMLLVACDGGGTGSSGDVLDREKFKEVLLGATLIEARINHELIVDHQSSAPTNQYYEDLFKEQGITKEQFSRSFDHYAARPAEMKAIYDEILTELSRRKDEQPR